jgi:hypothetical protein
MKKLEEYKVVIRFTEETGIEEASYVVLAHSKFDALTVALWNHNIDYENYDSARVWKISK